MAKKDGECAHVQEGEGIRGDTSLDTGKPATSGKRAKKDIYQKRRRSQKTTTPWEGKIVWAYPEETMGANTVPLAGPEAELTIGQQLLRAGT